VEAELRDLINPVRRAEVGAHEESGDAQTGLSSIHWTSPSPSSVCLREKKQNFGIPLVPAS